jgi:tape measure domain-containing protein
MAKSDVRVRILGENKTGAAFNKFKKDINSTQSALASLRNQIIAAFGVRELVRAGDTFVNLQNRMGALTGSVEGSAEAMAHMKRIALESRSDFSAVGDLFAKITFASKSMGLSQQQVADATQTVANTFIISGASAIEAANASRQLAQGLASGTLRGDELNSVMEQNSALSELLAKGLGVSTDKLREMGAAGKITAANILPTLINATADTSETVNNMQMTIGQSINVLKTNFITLVGEFEKSTGIFGKTANAVGFIATNMELLLVPTVALAVTAIPKLISMLNGLRLAMLANPAIAMAAGLSALFVAMNVAAKEAKTLDEQIADLDEQIKTLKETGEYEIFDGQTVKAGDELLNQLIAQRKQLILLRDESGKTVDVFAGFQSNYENVIAKTKASIQITKDFADTVEGQLTNAFKNFFDATSEQFNDFKDLATAVARAVINELINVFIVQKAVGMVKGALTNMGSLFNNDFGNAVDGMSDFDGGGYTGKGIRAGGMDGKGGFMAMVHPNETVIDHTKGQGMQSAPTVNFNISTVDAAGFDQLLASRKGLITSIINNAMNNQGKMGVV